MVKNPGRMALYEAVSKSRKKKTSDSGLERRFGLVRFKNRLKKRRAGKEPYGRIADSSNWPPSTKPKSQAVKGRGPLSIALMLLLIVAVIAAVIGGIKLASLWIAGAPTTDVQLQKRVDPSRVEEIGQGDVDDPENVSGNDSKDAPAERGDIGKELLRPLADHRIIITTYTNARDLGPVKDYFAKNGVETEIEERAGLGYYFLLTKEKYANPSRKGSDGNVAMYNIKRIGSLYKAPKGYERFAATPFQDAYGEKIK